MDVKTELLLTGRALGKKKCVSLFLEKGNFYSKIDYNHFFYGYDVKYLNRQVQRNIEKFPEDMMFQITNEEALSCSWCQNGTLNKSNDHRGFNLKYLPYAFTEQGIYMLMAVLKINKHLKRKNY